MRAACRAGQRAWRRRTPRMGRCAKSAWHAHREQRVSADHALTWPGQVGPTWPGQVGPGEHRPVCVQRRPNIIDLGPTLAQASVSIGVVQACQASGRVGQPGHTRSTSPRSGRPRASCADFRSNPHRSCANSERLRSTSTICSTSTKVALCWSIRASAPKLLEFEPDPDELARVWPSQAGEAWPISAASAPTSTEL